MHSLHLDAVGMLEFSPERTVLHKERASGSYHLSAYFLAKTISSLPIRLLLPALYVCISYPLAFELTPQSGVSYGDNAQQKTKSFFGVLLVLVLTAYAGESIGLFVGSITCNISLALSTCTAIALSMLIFGGFYVQYLPPYVNYLSSLSTVRYSFDALMQIEFKSTKHIYGENENVISSDVPIEAYGADSRSLWVNLIALIAMTVLFRVASYVALRYLPFTPDGRT
jgi:ABC-type multidrug transport system permease subunit